MLSSFMYEVFNSLSKAQTVILHNGLKNLMQIIILALIQDIGFLTLQNLSENLTVSISDKN